MLYQFKMPQQASYLDLRMMSQFEDLYICVLPLFANSHAKDPTTQLHHISNTTSTTGTTGTTTGTTGTTTGSTTGANAGANADADEYESETIGGPNGGLGGTSTGGIGFTGTNNVDEFGGDKRFKKQNQQQQQHGPNANVNANASIQHVDDIGGIVNGYRGCVGYDLIRGCFEIAGDLSLSLSLKSGDDDGDGNGNGNGNGDGKGRGRGRDRGRRTFLKRNVLMVMVSCCC
ncbi:unnamed protein product [Ambrosiozyma monospora]|uniref:Unnamed protein product n=1 Tax=Ambrosiozyma monospora TaxID=43982 RepID=A0A9W6WJK5_AMBMO|nr:unnamed protein product [Ambrosiozyma monospora]